MVPAGTCPGCINRQLCLVQLLPYRQGLLKDVGVLGAVF